MHHGVADLDTGGIGIQDQAAYLAGENVDQVGIIG